jgi:glycogen debranching enzyme
VTTQRSDRPTGPHGDEYEVVGRVGPVEISAPAVRVEARQERLVIKDGPVFLCARQDGDILPGVVSGEGLYMDDTRFLSQLQLTVGGIAPVLLSSIADGRYAAVVDSTNPDLELDDRTIPQQTLNVHRLMAVHDRLYVRIRLINFSREPVSTEAQLLLAADFADMFEVRGAEWRHVRGHALLPKTSARGFRFAYVGEDEAVRETAIEFDPPPSQMSVEAHGANVSWPIDLAVGEAVDLTVSVEPRSPGYGPPPRAMEPATAEAERSQAEWLASCSQIKTSNELFDRVLDASMKDMHALLTPVHGPAGRRVETVVAGIPWYVALFGRDSLLACYQTLMVRPALARETLLLLAYFQAREDDPWRDAEPGKILHELRGGELARAGMIPHTPYYGTVDATPLFLLLAAGYYRWTGDLETLSALRPHLDAALRWIDEHGDLDGDGFIEYRRRSRGGLDNQGWKDSHDAIVHADGSLAEPPIALVEAQAYVYFAKRRIAEVYEALGEGDFAGTLRAQAATLREAFNDSFWDPQEGCYVLALDGAKRQVRSVSSNAAHSLYCGIVDSARAAALVERLMAPDMFCGWGIRTLSSESPAYNPMSYHRGSVWPHDNAMAAAGFKRYGFQREMLEVAEAMFDVASGEADSRLPELYCGFSREEHSTPVAYPVACSPQAWAAAAPFSLVQSMLGISGRAPDNMLTVFEPCLPAWLDSVEIGGLRIGDSQVSLAFRGDAGATSFSLTESHGPARVVMSGAPVPAD